MQKKNEVLTIELQNDLWLITLMDWLTCQLELNNLWKLLIK